MKQVPMQVGSEVALVEHAFGRAYSSQNPVALQRLR